MTEEKRPMQAGAADIERRAVRGGALTAGAQFLRAIVDVTGTFILARLLLPADFGLVSMIVSLTGLIDLLKDFGLSTATIQRERIEHAQVSALFWINVAIGLGLMLLIMAAAPLIAFGYGRPELLPLTLVQAVATLLGCLPIQHQALLRRDMRFGTVAGIDVASSVIGTICAVASAFAGLGVWSLVLRPLARLSVHAILIFAASRFRPTRPAFAGVSDLVRFGGHISGFQFLNYLERNFDNVLVGRFVGAQALGFYTKAYEIMRLPLDQLMAPMSAVAVPSLSRLVQQPERYRAAFLSVVRLMLLVTVPLAPLGFFTAHWFVPAVLGPHWTGAVPILQWLVLGIAIKPLGPAAGWLFITQARTQELWRWGMLATAIAVASFVVGLQWGPIGVAAAYTAADVLVRMPILLYWSGRSGPVGTGDLVRCLGPAWTCAATTAAAYYLLGNALPDLQAGVRVAIVAPASLCIGALALLATPWGRVAFTDGVRVFRALRGAERSSARPPSMPIEPEDAS